MAHIEQLVDNETMEMYVSMFDSHLENTRRLVTGLDDEQEGDTTPAPSEESLSLSLFPSAYWSPTEKGAFFHALSIYSRHRPELIATTIRHAIPSSSVSTLQVTNMLALLRKASLSTILRGRKRKRDEIEAARIMTKEWAHFEEECADMLLMGEAAGRRDSLIQRRTEQLIKPQSSSPLPNDHDVVPQVDFDLVRPDALVQNHILHHRKRKCGEDDNHNVECDSHFAHSDVDRAAPTMGDSRPKRRRLLDLTPLHRKWIREDIFATLSVTRSKALKTLLHPKSEPPSAKLAPLLELATEAGLTKDSEELKDVDLLDIKKLRNVTK
ncbi:hypothetical protein DL93DRAFT_277383 [Clavulina sp. PMI_390]|nr:hypothetical protein DL93DRAFT_277383 [Clavulina sp. PMI_390]